jgi:ribosomal protein S27AE
MTMTTQQLREKIGAWLSDKTNHEGDLVDFLVDECGVVLKEDEQTRNARGEKWEEKDCPIEDNNDDCSRCGIILTNDDMYSETGKCEMCNLEEVEE